MCKTDALLVEHIVNTARRFGLNGTLIGAYLFAFLELPFRLDSSIIMHTLSTPTMHVYTWLYSQGVINSAIPLRALLNQTFIVRSY